MKYILSQILAIFRNFFYTAKSSSIFLLKTTLIRISRAKHKRGVIKIIIDQQALSNSLMYNKDQCFHLRLDDIQFANKLIRFLKSTALNFSKEVIILASTCKNLPPYTTDAIKMIKSFQKKVLNVSILYSLDPPNNHININLHTKRNTAQKSFDMQYHALCLNFIHQHSNTWTEKIGLHFKQLMLLVNIKSDITLLQKLKIRKIRCHMSTSNININHTILNRIQCLTRHLKKTIVNFTITILIVIMILMASLSNSEHNTQLYQMELQNLYTQIISTQEISWKYIAKISVSLENMRHYSQQLYISSFIYTSPRLANKTNQLLRYFSEKILKPKLINTLIKTLSNSQQAVLILNSLNAYLDLNDLQGENLQASMPVYNYLIKELDLKQQEKLSISLILQSFQSRKPEIIKLDSTLIQQAKEKLTGLNLAQLLFQNIKFQYQNSSIYKNNFFNLTAYNYFQKRLNNIGLDINNISDLNTSATPTEAKYIISNIKKRYSDEFINYWNKFLENSQTNNIIFNLRQLQNSKKINIKSLQLYLEPARAFINSHNHVLYKNFHSLINASQNSRSPCKESISYLQSNNNPAMRLIHISKLAEEPLKSYLFNSANRLWSTLNTQCLQRLNIQWKHQVYAYYKNNLQSNYPFLKHSQQDAKLSQFDQLYASKGLLNKFIQKYIAPLLRSKNKFRFKLSPALITLLHCNRKINAIFYTHNAANAGFSFSINLLHLNKSIKSITLNIGNKKFHYAYGPTNTKTFTWPTLNSLTFSLDAFDNNNFNFECNGNWCLFKFLQLAKINNAKNPTIYSLKRNHMSINFTMDINDLNNIKLDFNHLFFIPKNILH